MVRVVRSAALFGLLLFATSAFSAPDLFVEKSKLAPDFLDPGGIALFTLTTRNQGDAASSASDVRLRIDEGNDGSWEHTLTLPLGTLPPHARAVSRWQNAWTPIIGKHRFEFCVDPGAVSGDGTTANNCVSQEFVVPPATIPAGLDLMVYQVKLGRARDGRPMSFRAALKNVGSVTIPNVTTTISIDADPPLAGDGFDEVRDETKKTVRFARVWTATAGVHSFQICAQTTNPFDLDAANNCANGTFVVRNP
jgi:CARDB protein